jgi:RimJ/RimL family protein N-acetyltransferase
MGETSRSFVSPADSRPARISDPGRRRRGRVPERDRLGLGRHGLIVGGGNADQPVIAYVGIVPEQRGRGFVDELLAQAVATLTAAGASVIRADTDLANAPMANAFRCAGFEQFMARTEFIHRPA